MNTSKFLLLFHFFSFSQICLLSSQQSSMTVEGIDTSAIIMTTSNFTNPVIIEMAAGDPNASHTHYYIRNEADLLSIDVKSDLLTGGSFRTIPQQAKNQQSEKSLKAYDPDVEDIVSFDTGGNIRAAGNVRPGFNTASSGDGSIRYNSSNASLEVYAGDRWRSLSCQAFNLIGTNFNEEFNYTTVSGKAVIELQFNTPVDPTSVVLGTTFLATDYAGNPIGGNLTWNYNHTKLQFRSTIDFIDTCQISGAACLQVTLISSNSTGIISKSGCSLDGDGDGYETGNYIIQYIRLV